jgi:hypothetical protein
MVIAELPPVSASSTTREPQTVNFDTVLEPDREFLASVVWTCQTLTLGTGAYGSAISSDLRKASFWVVGGAPGRHPVNCHYTTTSIPPRVDDIQVGITLV